MPDPVPNPIAAQVIQPNPSVQVMGGGAGLPNPTPDMPTQQQMAAVSGPAPTVAQAHPAWHNFVNAMTGSQAEYQQTPDGPVLKPQSRAQKLFGGILTGAMMGLGAGGDASNTSKGGSPYARASQGVQDVQKSLQEQQDQKQKAAQQQWENQRQANEDRQKAASANTEEQLKQAQIAVYNLDRVKALHDIQTGGINEHKQLVKDAEPIVAAYRASGLDPVYENIPESQMPEFLKANQGAASKYQWQPVDVKPYTDADGNINYQTQWNAYDVNKNITIPPATYNDWKDSGMLDMHPDLDRNLKVDADGNRSLPYSAFFKYAAENGQMKTDARTRQQNDYQTKHDAAELEHIAAQTSDERATAAAAGDRATLDKMDIDQKKLEKSAGVVIATHGDDAWALPPNKGGLTPEQKYAMQPQIQKDIEGYRTELNDPLLKEQLNSLDPEVQKVAQRKATELHEQLDNARSHSIYVAPTAAQVEPVTFINPQGQQVIATTQAQIDKATKLGYKKSGGTGGPATVPQGKTMVQLPGQEPFAIDNDDVDTFTRNHPDLKIVQRGAANPVAAPETSGYQMGGVSVPR